jgi:uncharacterized protein YndB with AHSA1/START domain
MRSGRVTIRSERLCCFPASPEQVWTLLSQVDDYTRWWPWLRRFDAVDLVPGDDWRCTLRPPLPYPLRGVVHIEHVARPTLVVAQVSGDLSGRCRVELGDHAGGTAVRLASELTAVRGPITLVSRLVPTLAHWAHDRIVDSAVRRFADVLAATHGVAPAGADPGAEHRP